MEKFLIARYAGLFESSSENNYVQCLGIIPGKVTKVKVNTKVPNLGWDTISDEKYYFMHSYGVIFAQLMQF